MKFRGWNFIQFNWICFYEKRFRQLSFNFQFQKKLATLINRQISKELKLETSLPDSSKEWMKAINRKDYLRPYQRECLIETLSSFYKGYQRQAVSLAVGSGKTVVIASLIELIPNTISGDKVLILAHREELLYQMIKALQSFCPTLKVGLEKGTHSCDIESCNVVVASVQTLGYRGGSRLHRFQPTQFKAVIIDEAHHVASSTYKRVLDHFGLNYKNDNSDNDLIKVNNPYNLLLWGCSATLQRHDGKSLLFAFDKITFHIGLVELVKQGWLCDLKVTTIKTQLDLNDLNNKFMDFELTKLARKVDVPARNELVAKAYKRLCEHRKATIVFAVNLTHATNLMYCFERMGYKAHVISSNTPADLRRDLLEAFKNGEINILINCIILTEGLDIPKVDSIIIARPTRSQPLYQQMIGRGTRLYPGKQDCLIIDVVDQFDQAQLCTLPSLLGLNYDYELENSSFKELALNNNIIDNIIDDQNNNNEVKVKGSKISKIWLRQFEGLEDWLGIKINDDGTQLDSSFEMEVQKILKTSTLDWIMVNENKYLLNLPDGLCCIELNEDGHYKITFKRRLLPLLTRMKNKTKNKIAIKTNPGFTKAQILPIEADSLLLALRAVETWLRKHHGYSLKLALRSSPWKQYPITKKQISSLLKLIQRSTKLFNYLKNLDKDLNGLNKNNDLKKTLDFLEKLKEKKGKKEDNKELDLKKLDGLDYFQKLTRGQADKLILILQHGKLIHKLKN